MNYGKVLAWTICIISFGAGVGYACARDWRHAAYWFLACAIQAVVTY